MICIEKILKESQNNMDLLCQNFKDNISKIQSSKISIKVLNDIKILYFGKMTLIEEISSLKYKDFFTIIITPWDNTILNKIQNSIINQNLGLNVSLYKNTIVVKSLLLTQEKKINLIKVVKKQSELSKINIRNCGKLNKNFFKKNKLYFSDDQLKNFKNDLQQLTLSYIKIIDNLVIKKSNDIYLK